MTTRNTLVFILVGLLMMGIGLDLYGKPESKASPEDKAASKVAKKEAAIEAILGTNSSWKPTVFKDLRKGMTCREAAQVFKGIRCGSSPFIKVSKGLSTVSEYNFYFQNGRLFSCKIVFGSRLFDQKVFTTALVNVAVRKWGKVANPQDIKWTTGNYENVRMKFYKGKWEIDYQFTALDPGDVDVNAFDETVLRTGLNEFFGDRNSCAPAYFDKFKYHMTWQELKGMFPELQYDESKTMNNPKVSVQGHPLVAGLHFRIDSGLLEHVTAIFHWQIPRQLFKDVSFQEMRTKYGSAVKDEMAVKDRVSAYVRNCGFVTREWLNNYWTVGMSLKGAGGNVPASPSTTGTTTFTGNLEGDWKLISPKDNKVLRVIQFTPAKEFKIKENGKIVLTTTYDMVGNGIYFTSGTGRALFATVSSLTGNRLTIVLAKKNSRWVFQKM